MKRLALAVCIIALTFIVGVFAVAVAQRDMRNRTANLPLTMPEYTLQATEPIELSEVPRFSSHANDDEVPSSFDARSGLYELPPPLPAQRVVRANDESIPSYVQLASDQSPAMIQPPASLQPSAQVPGGNLSPPPLYTPQSSGSSRNPAAATGRVSGGAVTGGAVTGANVNTDSNATPNVNALRNSYSLGGPTNNNSGVNNPPIQNPSINSAPINRPLSANPALNNAALNGPTLNNTSVNGPVSPSPTSNNALSNIPRFNNTASNNAGPNSGISGNASMRNPALVGAGSNGPAPGGPGAPPAFNTQLMNPQAMNGGPNPAAQPINPGATEPPALGAANNNHNNPMSPGAPSVSLTRPVAPQPAFGSPAYDGGRIPNDGSRNAYSQMNNGPGLGAPNLTPHSPIRLVSSKPGQRTLDGMQNPSIHLQKRAPEEIQVGQKATFTIVVRNVGNATAHDVVVNDLVPEGTELVATNPPAQVSNGHLQWSLGEIAAGAELSLTTELIPRIEGEIGSVATVVFAAQASVRTMSTQPNLEVKQRISPSIMIGSEVTVEISVTNTGTGVARGVELIEDVPPGLRSSQGQYLSCNLFDIAPMQTRTAKLSLAAVDPGKSKNVLTVKSLNTSPIESVENFEIIAPQLKLSIDGPGRRYLESPATYKVTVENNGTAIARGVEFFAYLPAGLRFSSAGNQGGFIASQNAVGWALGELAPGASATTDLVVLPVKEGNAVIRLQGNAENGHRAEPTERAIQIEGRNELAFHVEDDTDPVEINGQTTYTVRITNKGTRPDQDIKVMVGLPPGSQVLQAHGPVEWRAVAGLLEFQAIPEMQAQDEQTIRFTVRHSQEGNHIVRVEVSSRNRPKPVSIEESTVVYSDR